MVAADCIELQFENAVLHCNNDVGVVVACGLLCLYGFINKGSELLYLSCLAAHLGLVGWDGYNESCQLFV